MNNVLGSNFKPIRLAGDILNCPGKTKILMPE